MIDKGDAFRSVFDKTGRVSALEDAVEIYKITDLLLGRINTEQSDLKSKLFWRSDSRRLYEHAIEACYLQGNTTDAFYFFEKSRAVLLNEQLREQNWFDEKDILIQTQLKRKVLQLERESSGLDKVSNGFKQVQAELFKDRQELEITIDAIKARNPLYYQNNLDSSIITIREVRKNILKDHQALMEIFTGDSVMYSLIITSSTIHFKMMDKTRFDSLRNLFTLFISNVFLLNDQFSRFVQISSQLYEVIFKKDSLPSGRIIISPDGFYFPFEALISNILPIKYLLNDHSVSYTYSARYLTNQFVAGSKIATHNFLGVAPVNYPSDLHLASLNGSNLSLERIGSKFYDAENLIENKASKANFLKKYSRCHIVQLYTHASDSSRNGEPVIYFADSALYLSDIMSEDKPITGLIVLSACETGKGELNNGEGVFSMNRAFAALGIASSITSLWSLDNESTYRLTELFYKYLALGLPADISLQKAKLEFIKSSLKLNQLPYFWACPVLVGKNYSIENVEKPTIFMFVSILGAIALVTIIGFPCIYKTE